MPLHLNAIDENELKDTISKLEQQIAESKNKQSSLSNEIKYINSQIELSRLKIQQAETNIKILEDEISGLSTKIDNLDVYLNHLSVVYIQQVVQNYKLDKRLPPFTILFTGNFNKTLQQYKYISTVQKTSQETLVSMETVRTDYDSQKTTKEVKQKELEDMQTRLAKEQVMMASQKKSKDELLAITKNDEKTYQSLLAQARAELNALSNFTLSFGSSSSCLSSSPGVGSDGWFFSQRDPAWCSQHIGYSNETIGSVGCFISSIAMVWKMHGFSMTPSTYASNSSYFFGRTAWMSNPSPPPGYSYRRVGYSQSTLDNELARGNPVIVQLSMNNSSGMHFVVVKSGSNGNYKMHDPWYGPDLDFNKYYSTSSILSLRLITK